MDETMVLPPPISTVTWAVTTPSFTSTPKADPSGDYAWRLSAKADKVKPGAEKALDAKAVKLTGGPTSEKAPKGRNQYGWVMETSAPTCS